MKPRYQLTASKIAGWMAAFFTLVALTSASMAWQNRGDMIASLTLWSIALYYALLGLACANIFWREAELSKSTVRAGLITAGFMGVGVPVLLMIWLHLHG